MIDMQITRCGNPYSKVTKKDKHAVSQPLRSARLDRTDFHYNMFQFIVVCSCPDEFLHHIYENIPRMENVEEQLIRLFYPSWSFVLDRHTFTLISLLSPERVNEQHSQWPCLKT